LVLEDDSPTRPSGFCNVNQLFEINIAQAKRIDHEAVRSTGRTSLAYARLDQDTAGLLLTWSDAAAWTVGIDRTWIYYVK
jgi:hypothetical protein